MTDEVDRAASSAGFEIAAPRRVGERLTPSSLSYAKRASSVRQAAAWNDILVADPDVKVGVGPRDDDGRYPLIWIPRSAS